MEFRRPRPPRLLLSISQVVLAILALICLGSLSSTQCWYYEPSERGYIWWLISSTMLVSIGAYFLEAFEAEILLRTAIDAAAMIFWVGGIGAAGQLNKFTGQVSSCLDDYGPYPETGAVIAFAVLELILFALGVYHARRGLPWPRSKGNDLEGNGGIEHGRAQLVSSSATNTGTPMSHLRAGDFSEYLTVHVGEGDSRRDFPVPKGLLCRRSKFVKSATSDTWTEKLGKPKSKDVDLSDDDPETFETYLACVMTNTVAVKDLDVTHPTRIQSDDVFTRLIHAYVLADKLGDPESMNHLIDRLGAYCLAVHRVPDCEVVTYACGNSVKTSPLRLLLVDLYYAGYDRDATRDERLEGMPNEFLLQYMSASRDVQTIVPGSQRYHVSIDKRQMYRGLFQGEG